MRLRRGRSWEWEEAVAGRRGGWEKERAAVGDESRRVLGGRRRGRRSVDGGHQQVFIVYVIDIVCLSDDD